MSETYDRLQRATEQIEPKGASREAWDEYRDAFREWSRDLDGREHTR